MKITINIWLLRLIIFASGILFGVLVSCEIARPMLGVEEFIMFLSAAVVIFAIIVTHKKKETKITKKGEN
jgi:hypothetical protein